MATKILVLAVACLIHTTVMALNDELILPPILEPEQFDQVLIPVIGDLSLKQAIVLSLKHNPQLATYAWEVRSKEINRIEAGLLPNPELELEIENFAGSGGLSGFTSAETTIALSQLIELGDKRMKRRRLASTDRDLARWDYEVKRVDLLSQTTLAYTEVLGSQEKLKIAEEIKILAEEIYQTVKKRVKAGKVTPLDEVKAKVELSKARLSQVKAKHELTISKHKLVTNWGETNITFDKVLGDFYSISSMPNLDAIVNKLINNPELARWATEISRQKNAITLAEAETVPDIAVTAGIRHFNETDDIAAVANISIPLFLFNNKQTNIQRNEIELQQTLKQQNVIEKKLRSALLITYQRLTILHQEASLLKNEILPSTKEALHATKEIYRLGKINLLSLLDAQRSYFETRQQYINTVKEYHRFALAIERLIGTSLDEENAYTTEETIR